MTSRSTVRTVVPVRSAGTRPVTNRGARARISSIRACCRSTGARADRRVRWLMRLDLR
ncbi:hypothetical protein QRX60_32815 [Amycolatopsis mongoliensis]|uniref:Uncharacterized protein n=1 Tax=Amycolatopsis mongoliensis TaxID=715475 RepID=A0A9Y2JJE4_9PSEU|nr:hypothetical protein [Amycolatopsis sp. 4-36]WIX98824.1 hypothetical protein QRX60_32815 [Amycolatopsis sp. 4-36]